MLLNEASAYPHGSVKTQQVRKGSVILIDCGCSVRGYQSDITLTWERGRRRRDRVAGGGTVRMDEARARSALAEARAMQGGISEATALLAEAQALLKDGDGWRERKARQENDARRGR